MKFFNLQGRPTIAKQSNTTQNKAKQSNRAPHVAFPIASKKSCFAVGSSDLYTKFVLVRFWSLSVCVRFFFCIYSFTFERNEKKSETPDRMRQKLMISGKKCKHTKTARIKTEVTKIVCFRVRVRCCVCTHLRWCIQKCVSFRSAVQNDLESPIPECKNDNFMNMNKKTNKLPP